MKELKSGEDRSCLAKKRKKELNFLTRKVPGFDLRIFGARVFYHLIVVGEYFYCFIRNRSGLQFKV